MHTILNILAIASTVLLISCGSDGGSADNTGQCSALGLTDASATAKIVNGTPCGELSKSPVVVILKNLPNGQTGVCTGTMLSPNKVLTAAHCLDGAASIDVLFEIASGKFAYVNASFWNIHPSFSRDTFTNDVGIVQSPVALPVPNLPILTSVAPKVGQRASIFGYGVASAGAQIDGKLRSGEMTIAGVDTEKIYTYFESSTSNTCSGDSGGPMLLSVGGQQSIIGITSYGSSIDCSAGELSAFMNLQSPSTQNFIRSVAPDARYN